jgi:pectate lyase
MVIYRRVLLHFKILLLASIFSLSSCANKNTHITTSDAPKENQTELKTINNSSQNITKTVNHSTNKYKKTLSGVKFEGFGENVTGGEIGDIYIVSSLDNNGSGSLRDALSSGDRYIIFNVSGVINLSSEISIKDSNITIDGFSSPNGITVNGAGIIISGNRAESSGDHASNIIIQGIRVQNTSGDGLRVWRNAHDIVIDHVSVLDSGDGNIDITEGAHNITISWCLMTGSASGSTLQSYRAFHVSYHHNLYFGSHRRNPLIANSPRSWSTGQEPVPPYADIQFNVLWKYGWGMSLNSSKTSANIINNLFTNSGVNGNSSFIMNRATNGYLEGNIATMNIKTGSQWLTKKAITTTNSNSTGIKHLTPKISGSNRFTEWLRVVNEAGLKTRYPDVKRESEARSWTKVPAKAILNSAWNDG